MKAGRVIVGVFVRDEGLGVPAVLPVVRDVFVKMEERRARAMEGDGGSKEVAGYIYRFAWGWGVLTMASFSLVYGKLNHSFLSPRLALRLCS